MKVNSTVFTVRLQLLPRQQGQGREGEERGGRGGEDGLHFQEVCDLENEGESKGPI